MPPSLPSASLVGSGPVSSRHAIRRGYYTTVSLIIHMYSEAYSRLAAAQIFDEMVAMTEQLLQRVDKQRPDPPAADLRARAAITVAMALGIPAFQAYISRSIGTDILSPEGDRRIVSAVLDIQSHPAISPDTARTLRQGLDKPDA